MLTSFNAIQRSDLSARGVVDGNSSPAASGKMQRPVRILHVVTRMHRAGVETWLMHLLRRTDPGEFQMDFLVHRDEPGHFDDEIRSLGGKIHYAAPLRNVLGYATALRNLLRKNPPYDIFHAHLDCFSGHPLKCAADVGIPVRIAHVHVDLAEHVSHLRWSRYVYACHSQALIRRSATMGISVSKRAGQPLFGGRRWGRDWRVIPYGIDLTPFVPAPTRENLRTEFGVSDDTLVIGHVGRFAEQKNHAFLVRIAEALRKKTDKFRLFLIGDGPLRPAIERQVAAAGIHPHVTFLGVRPDVPRLLTSLFDVVLFPSLFEGIPLTMTEAQSAGCPVVMSDAIAPETDVFPDLVTRLSLADAPPRWAEAVLSASHHERSFESRRAAFDAVVDSPANLTNCLATMRELYAGKVAANAAA